MPISSAFEFEETSSPQVLGEVFRLRAAVWRESGVLAPGAFPEGSWQDPVDDVARHWVVRDSAGHVVGAARLSIHQSLDELEDAADYRSIGLSLPGPIAAPARVVVCPSTRGCGLAGRLLERQEQAARRGGARYAVREASPDMVRLLERRNWRILGTAPEDPRFPGIRFEIAVLPLASDTGELAA